MIFFYVTVDFFFAWKKNWMVVENHNRKFHTIKWNDSHGVTFILRRDIKTTFLCKENCCFFSHIYFWVCLHLFFFVSVYLLEYDAVDFYWDSRKIDKKKWKQQNNIKKNPKKDGKLWIICWYKSRKWNYFYQIN